VDITAWHKNQAAVLYYKGDIITLWLFLSDLFEQYDELSATFAHRMPYADS